MHIDPRPVAAQAIPLPPAAKPGKLEAVQMAKERLGDVPAGELADFIAATFGISMQPVIVTVLLGTLREREFLQASKRRALSASASGGEGEHPSPLA